MKQSVAYCWGLLCHKLEIGLIRVGEPIRVMARNFLGVASLFFPSSLAKIKGYLFYREGLYLLNAPHCQVITPPYTISTGTQRL